jgi:hypothetical protein
MDNNIPDKYTASIFKVKMEGPTYSSGTSALHGVIDQKTTTSVSSKNTENATFKVQSSRL